MKPATAEIWTHLGLPLFVSLTVHALLLGFLAFKLFDVVAPHDVPRGEWQAGIIDAPAHADHDPFRPPQRGDDADAGGELNEALEALAKSTPAGAGDVQDLPALPLDIAPPEAGAGSPAGGESLGLGSGSLALLGTGGGAGGEGSGDLGSALGGHSDTGTQAAIWNVNVRALRIAYVVDFSGSILTAVDDLKRELKRSIGKLSPAQTFNVILFYGAGGGQDEQLRTESFRPKLVPADAATRRAFFTWIDQHAPMGRTEPLPAMQRALALAPEAIFFFSDGFFDDRVVAEIRRLNQDVRAQIHCLVFDELLLEDRSGLPRETEGSRRLQRIAEANGGKLKIVTGKDLVR